MARASCRLTKAPFCCPLYVVTTKAVVPSLLKEREKKTGFRIPIFFSRRNYDVVPTIYFNGPPSFSIFGALRFDRQFHQHLFDKYIKFELETSLGAPNTKTHFVSPVVNWFTNEWLEKSSKRFIFIFSVLSFFMRKSKATIYLTLGRKEKKTYTQDLHLHSGLPFPAK